MNALVIQLTLGIASVVSSKPRCGSAVAIAGQLGNVATDARM